MLRGVFSCAQNFFGICCSYLNLEVVQCLVFAFLIVLLFVHPLLAFSPLRDLILGLKLHGFPECWIFCYEKCPKCFLNIGASSGSENA